MGGVVSRSRASLFSDFASQAMCSRAPGCFHTIFFGISCHFRGFAGCSDTSILFGLESLDIVRSRVRTTRAFRRVAEACAYISTFQFTNQDSMMECLVKK